MANEYYGAPTTPTSDYLAHYGVKGMKWGVRKAIEKGNNRKLAKQYRKAAKKLAKLEKRAASGKNYARRAAMLGAGAAAAGGLAVAGTGGVGHAMKSVGRGVSGVAERFARGSSNPNVRKVGHAVNAAGNAISNAGGSVAGWGKNTNISDKIYSSHVRYILNNQNNNYDVANKISKAVTGKPLGNVVSDVTYKRTPSGVKIRNNDSYARIGAAALGAGLAAGAGYNAYRAATTKRAARKADEFRKEMNKAFAGTQFGGGQRLTKKKKRR